MQKNYDKEYMGKDTTTDRDIKIERFLIVPALNLRENDCKFFEKNIYYK